jgi:hypothetical protein
LKAIPAELLAHARARARASLPGRAARARRGRLAGAASCGRAGCAATAVLVPPPRRHRGQSTSAERHHLTLHAAATWSRCCGQAPGAKKASTASAVSTGATAMYSPHEHSKHRAPCRVGWGHGHVSLHPTNAPSAARWVMASTRIARSTTANKHKVGNADGMVARGRPHLTLRVFWPHPSTAAGSPRPRTRRHLAITVSHRNTAQRTCQRQ